MSQPPGYEPRTPMPKRKTPGLAIASLVCGLASFVCLAAGLMVTAAHWALFVFLATVVTGIPAVITGHMALGRIKRSVGALAGRGLAIAGLIVGYASTAIIAAIFVLFALLIPTLKAESSKAACAVNLRQIGIACQLYAAEHNGRHPERLSELYPDSVPNLDVFVCPSTGDKILSPDEIDAKTSYEYYGAALNASPAGAPPHEAILACDKAGNHQRGKHILYADGHVEWEVTAGESRAEGMNQD